MSAPSVALLKSWRPSAGNDEVQAIYDAKDAEEQAKFQRDYDRYAEAFTKADAALRRYRSELHNIINLKGSGYLRPAAGLQVSADWIQRRRERREHGQPGMAV